MYVIQYRGLKTNPWYDDKTFSIHAFATLETARDELKNIDINNLHHYRIIRRQIEIIDKVVWPI